MTATPQQITQWADAYISEIRYDIRLGQVPATVNSFSELYDHVDANEYGLQLVPQDDMPWDEYLEVLNAVEDEVDRRIKAGEHQ
jgi:hypothetical protein